MQILTLGFLFRNNQILLAMKKRGFGIGKWNGYGGKLEIGEEILDGLVREIKEESGLIVSKEMCVLLGEIDFYFIDKIEWNQKVFVYRIDDFDGVPVETEEMSPKFFDIGDLPYNDMWKGDDKWIPKVISKEKFKGQITFKDMGQTVLEIQGF